MDVEEILEPLFKEIAGATSVASVHPLRLDRWHRLLLALPEPLYMQLGCEALFRQVLMGAEAVRAMIKIVGSSKLPVPAAEIARRRVGTFVLHVASFSDAGTWPFQITWDAKSSAWRLQGESRDVTKIVPTLELAVEKAMQWAAELEAQLGENTTDLVASEG